MLQDQQTVGRQPSRGDGTRPSDPDGRASVAGEAPGLIAETDASPAQGRKRDDVDDAPGRSADDATSSGDAPPSDAENSSSDSAGEPNILRRHPFWALGIAAAVVALAAGGYVYWLTRLHPYESTDDAFVDARQFSIAPKVAGYIVDVPVTDNQHVEAGAVLFQIDRRDYAVALAQARAQVASAEASIRNFDAQIEGSEGAGRRLAGGGDAG